MDTLDLAWPATTDAAKLAERARPDDSGAMTVIFATYQSSPVIERAQRDHGLPGFDLAVCDEAHRTAGAIVDGAQQSHFTMIHGEDRIQAERRPMLPVRHTPALFSIDIASFSLKDVQQQMEFPFFSLSKKPDLEPCSNEDRQGNSLEISAHSKGLPTIYDKYALIYAISQIMERLNRWEQGRGASSFMQATCWNLPTVPRAGGTTSRWRMHSSACEVAQ